MAVLCITGIAPGIGKTAVGEMLLGRMAGWRVARVRMADEMTPADTARLADAPYRVITINGELADDDELARLSGAGGQDPLILLAQPRGLADGLKALRARLRPAENLLVEGNAYLWAAEADLALMVIGPSPGGKGLPRVRQSVRELFSKVSVWVWNTRTNPSDEGFFEFPQALARMGFAGAVSNQSDFHHANPRSVDPGNTEFLECILHRLDASWWRQGSEEFLRRIGFRQSGQA